MKKFLCLLLIFILLLQPAAYGTTLSADSEAELMNLTPGLPIPYDVTHMFCFYDTFQADSIQDIYRLLELCKLSHLYLYVPAEIEEETINIINTYAEENMDNFGGHNFSVYCEKHDDYLSISLPWKGDMKRSLPVLYNADDVYKAVQEAKTHPTYAKSYKIDTNYFTPDGFFDETI